MVFGQRILQIVWVRVREQMQHLHEVRASDAASA
jgi:hypothetical protein